MKNVLFTVAFGAMVFGWLSTAVYAQEKEASPEIRALNQRVGKEINANLQCSTYSYTLEDRVKAAEAEVKRLTDKYEPKSSDK